MPVDVEHADPTIKYVAEDGYWYNIPARRTPVRMPPAKVTPGDGPTWYFFQEIFRSRDLKSWESGT